MSKAPSQVPAQAITVLQTFLNADLRKDETVMKASVTRQTLASGRLHGGPEDVTYTLGEGVMEGAVAVIPVKAVPNHPPENGPASMELQCMVVQEDGEWRFDLAGTMERMMGGAVQQVAEVMAGALEGVGRAVAEGLGQGTQSGGHDAIEQAKPTGVPAEAIEVLQTFLDADLRKDETVMKACVTRQTRESGQVHGGPGDVTYTLGDGSMEGAVAVIPVRAVANHPPENGPASMELQCRVVQEDGEWKFDLAGTMQRMRGGGG